METEIWLNFGSFAYAFQAQALRYRDEELIVRWLPRTEATLETDQQHSLDEDLRAFTGFLQLIQEKSRSLLLTEVRVFYEPDAVKITSRAAEPNFLRLTSQLPPVLSGHLPVTLEEAAGVSLAIRYLIPASASDAELLEHLLRRGWLQQETPDRP